MKTPKITKTHMKRKIKQAIQILNDSVILKLAPSPIHGVGVFAVQDIEKNARLYADSIPQMFDVPHNQFRKIKLEVAEELIGHWPRIVNNLAFLHPDTKRTSYINHAPTKEQVNYDFITDTASKGIKKGEEVLADYRKLEGWQIAFPFLDSKTK